MADKPARKNRTCRLELSVRSFIKPVVGLLKMSFTIKSLKNAMPRREIAKDLPSFNYENVELREQIGHGAYGMVCKGKYNKFKNEVVVIKKLSGESANEENCFVKEARLMFSLNHENIVTFKAFSSFPCAIMMEYLCFNFSKSQELSYFNKFKQICSKNVNNVSLKPYFRRTYFCPSFCPTFSVKFILLKFINTTIVNTSLN